MPVVVVSKGFPTLDVDAEVTFGDAAGGRRDNVVVAVVDTAAGDKSDVLVAIVDATAG
jgi:hypothetical protein